MKKALALSTVSAGLSATITAGMMNTTNVLPAVVIALAVFATAGVMAIIAVMGSK
jgi:hypothetical protein